MEKFPDIPGYKIEKKLGEGRIADIYLAVKEEIDQKVIIKILIPELIHDKKFVKRFLYEVRNIAKLDHPNIVKILDIGEIADNYYCVMEYLKESLRERINKKQSDTPELKGDKALGEKMDKLDVYGLFDIFRQLFDALDYAHQEDAIHRDIRPDNIFFREDGTPVIVDFFISSVIRASDILRKKGVRVSPPHYANPEQVLRKPLDSSSDIYSLGITLYELLTGKPPYDAEDSIAIENQHVVEPAPRLPEHLGLFQPLIDRMMAKAKEERAQSGAELILLMEELSDQLPETNIEEPLEEEAELEIDQEIELDLDLRGRKETMRQPGIPVQRKGIVELIAKLQNPKVLIPIAVAMVIVVLLVILIGPSGDSETDESTKPQQVLLPKEEQEREMLYASKFKLAQRDFKAGKYEIAQQQLNKAEKIKITKELEILKKQIKNKIAEKKDSEAFKKASKINTPASYEKYLSNYPSGRHTREALKKIEEFKELERKREEEKKRWAASRVKLRSSPKILIVNEVKSMLAKHGFFEKYYNKTGNFRNYYKAQTINNNKVILDNATGLIWHQAGSEEYMNYRKAGQWVEELNRQKYAGYSDWRLPTLEEASSLLKSGESPYSLYINPIFSKEQRYIWTCDKFDKDKMWVVDFFGGDLSRIPIRYESYVRPVRSKK